MFSPSNLIATIWILCFLYPKQHTQHLSSLHSFFFFLIHSVFIGGEAKSKAESTLSQSLSSKLNRQPSRSDLFHNLKTWGSLDPYFVRKRMKIGSVFDFQNKRALPVLTSPPVGNNSLTWGAVYSLIDLHFNSTKRRSRVTTMTLQKCDTLRICLYRLTMGHPNFYLCVCTIATALSSVLP